jgi:hypothetical protein
MSAGEQFGFYLTDQQIDRGNTEKLVVVVDRDG